ncbi:hypothetical protein LISE100100_03365 [Listeria seeligeri]|nr:conserved hypothetical protein [Listeria seeligeri serovar 1/2b str. SLCC3954]
MTRIEIAEVNHFSHELKIVNQQAKTQITAIQNAITTYLQDDSLSGEAISASKGYYAAPCVLLLSKRFKLAKNLYGNILLIFIAKWIVLLVRKLMRMVYMS